MQANAVGEQACSSFAGGCPMSNMRVLATDLEFPEGPVVMPDGSVVLVEIRGRRLTRVWPDGRKEVVAQIPGGPNGAALGPDGKMYICNNGGFSWIPTRNMIMPRSEEHTSELQSQFHLVCRLLLEKKKIKT